MLPEKKALEKGRNPFETPDPSGRLRVTWNHSYTRWVATLTAPPSLLSTCNGWLRMFYPAFYAQKLWPKAFTEWIGFRHDFDF